MPAHLPLSGRRYLIPLVQAASLSTGATGCFSGALLGEWTLVEIDGKDADLFSSAAAGGHSVEPQPYAYARPYGYYGYYDNHDDDGYNGYTATPDSDETEPVGTRAGPAAHSIPVPARSPSDGASGGEAAEDCDQRLGLELSLDVDERDGENYEGEAEGGLVHTLVCDGRVESREVRRRDGDVEAEHEGKGRYTVEIDLAQLDLELDCEVDGSELECEADDANIELDELRFRRGD